MASSRPPTLDDDPTAAGGSGARAHARLGTILGGKYRLDRLLGIGGMAVVFEATHRNNKQFAVKILHSHLAANQGIRARFLREGYAANSVKHAGAVAVLDDDVAEEGAPFLVMELLEGDELDRILKKAQGRLPVRAVLSIGHQLLDILAAAHAKGIVHRDIKPANLFITTDGTLKVLDFGIARVREALGGTVAVQTTHTGVLLGTPAFMAPEQAFAKTDDIDGQTDVWAVGATLFTCLTGSFVHEGENGTQVMILAATTAARPVAAIGSEIPAPVARVLDRALAFDKAARWPSAEAMRDAIAAVYLSLYSETIAPVSLVGLFRDVPARDVRAPLTDSGLVTPSKAESHDTTYRPPGVGSRSRWVPVAIAAAFAATVLAFGAFELGERSSVEAGAGLPSAPARDRVQPMPPRADDNDAATTDGAIAPDVVSPRPPATSATPIKHAPCKFVTTIDKNGETHFACPCASCQ
jgi:serine/threonine protein kinase